jgi:predicted HTH transcriptional regulator
VPWRNLNVLAVQLYPSNTHPHYQAKLGPEDGVFIRVGSTNRKAEALQIEELKRLNRMNSLDEQAIPELKSEAIDFQAASELFALTGNCPRSHGRLRASSRNIRAVW